MNNRKFFGHAALAFGLLAAGSSFAEDTNTTEQARVKSQEGPTYQNLVKEKEAKQTAEQRSAMKSLYTEKIPENANSEAGKRHQERTQERTETRQGGSTQEYGTMSMSRDGSAAGGQYGGSQGGGRGGKGGR
jgi:hypothetical protein